MGTDIEKTLFGESFFGEANDPTRSILAAKFIVPPFTVLDARTGNWIARKKAWLKFGLTPREGRFDPDDFELIDGRAPGTAFNKNLDNFGTNLRDKYDKKSVGLDAKQIQADVTTGMSGFDPVLCECMFKWFCPPGGKILDPFGGEASKGIVAEILGYHYTGVELRKEQVDINNLQASQFGIKPNWLVGDSAQLRKIVKKKNFDFVFTSPPYYDLEIFSKSDKDGSFFETYEQFMEWYKVIFKQCVRKMANNRFLVVKVGEVRDKKTGFYYNFVADNITCFLDLGLQYYNELILVTRGGSLPLRAGNTFNKGLRKISKSHQNILVFFKGDLEGIREEFPEL